MKNVNNGSIRVIGGRRYRLNLDDSSFQALESNESRCPMCSRYISASEDSDIPICRFCASASPSMLPLMNDVGQSSIPSSLRSYIDTTAATQAAPTASDIDPETYAEPFLKFMTNNPTVFHAVDGFATRLKDNGFVELSEREDWKEKVKAGGKYFSTRNGSSMMAFVVGKGYKAGNGMAMVAGHIDALTARLKPISKKRTTEGYVQLGVAPYAGGMNMTWWDRDLSIGGRVMVKDPGSGKTTSKLVKLGWPIAKIPTLAPHFGAPANGPFNKETQMVPIIGLEGAPRKTSTTKETPNEELDQMSTTPDYGSFISTQPPRLVELIAKELKVDDANNILDWELELFDPQPAALFGLDLEFISACRIDDKICSWAAMEGLVYSADAVVEGSTVALAGFFDDEEIGSKLRQGAAGNYMPITVERIVECFGSAGRNTMGITYANSFLLSADVTHAVNPNFAGIYLEDHKPHLNVGLAVAADPNGHMTTDAVSSAILKSIAEKSDSKLQIFQIRNDSRSGGTVGPMLSSAMGVRGIDAGIAQLSMHSIRATVGNLDPGLGAKIFAGFFEHYEEVDKEFSST